MDSDSLDDDELDALLEVDVEAKNKEDQAREAAAAAAQGTHFERVRVRRNFTHTLMYTGVSKSVLCV